MTPTLAADNFHLDLAGSLGSDPGEVESSFFTHLDRLTALRDGGQPAVALIEAEASARAALAFLENVVGPEDMAVVLGRCVGGCKRRADLSAYVTGLYIRGNAR